MRGPGDGSYLNLKGCDIAISEIVVAVNESIDITSCKGKRDCQGKKVCLKHAGGGELGSEIHNFLSSILLADLSSRKETQRISKRQSV